MKVEGECIEWTGYIDRCGYGQIRRNRRTLGAHRWMYEQARGPIPDGMQLDHLCRNRACVNPGHLEPVTQRENALRGESFAALNHRKTHCKRGHEFTPENTRDNGKARVCRTCARLRQAAYKTQPRGVA